MTNIDQVMTAQEWRLVFADHPTVTAKIANALTRYGIDTVRKLLDAPGHTLSDMRHFGPLCQEATDQVRQQLSQQTGHPLPEPVAKPPRPAQSALMTLDQVAAHLDVHASGLTRLRTRDRTFPQPVLGPNKGGTAWRWLRSDINSYVARNKSRYPHLFEAEA